MCVYVCVDWCSCYALIAFVVVQILQSWHTLSMPLAYRCAFVLGINSQRSSSSSSQPHKATQLLAAAADSSNNAVAAPAAAPSSSQMSTAAAAGAGHHHHQQQHQVPWLDRAQCQAHIALLACLHQFQEDEPVAAQQQRGVFAEELRLVEAGLAQLQAG